MGHCIWSIRMDWIQIQGGVGELNEKKWKCNKEAVPDHKYCKRHIHRGKHRSRKLVEACQAGTPRAIAITNHPISLPVDSSSNSNCHPKSVLQLQWGYLKSHPSL
ncbi:hypothetical protein SLE2022_227760 [Rubroshorea leprosula]